MEEEEVSGAGVRGGEGFCGGGEARSEREMDERRLVAEGVEAVGCVADWSCEAA